MKIGSTNPCERYVSARQDCLVHPSRWVINNFLLHSWSLTCAGCIALKQQYVPHTNTNTLAIIPTYSGILSAIKKALRELVEEYQGVGKFFWDLMEGQERNMAQLERIGATMERRWSLEGGKWEWHGEVQGWPQRKSGGGDSIVHLLLVYWFCFN